MSTAVQQDSAQTGGVRVVEDQGGRGKGIAAAKDFKLGDVIMLYSKTFVAEKVARQDSIEDVRYRFDTGAGYYYRDEKGLGHLVNDGVDPRVIRALHACKTIEHLEVWEGAYMKNLVRQMLTTCGPNVEFVELHGAGKGLDVRAIRDIKSGEDLFAGYGADYWIGDVSMNPKADPWTRMASVAWAMKRVAFPALGLVNKMNSVLCPITAEDGKPSILNLSSYSMDPKKATAGVSTSSGIDELCSRWLQIVGIDSMGPGLRGWYGACQRVGTLRMKLTGSPITVINTAEKGDADK